MREDVMKISGVALCILLGAVISGICSQPIDGFDDDVPFSDMDIITENNPLETEEGEPLVEGDILLPKLPKYSGNMDKEEELEERKGLLNIISLWPSGRVTYNFHPSVNEETRSNIRAAIGEWERETCLKFHETSFDLSFIRFRTDGSGCWSMVGRQNNPFTGQDVNIGPGCERTPVVVHEIGHAIGLYHEQSRQDRDGYIKILWNNIPSGLQSQFSTGMEFSRGVEYDYTSVMHYSSMAFSNKPFEKNTIVTKNPHYQRLIGTGRRISFRDAKLVNRMYSCNLFCPNTVNDTQQCQNGGYLSPYRGEGSCHCICPPGTTGDYCEDMRNSEYYNPPICGGNVTEEEEIETPGYPKRVLPNDSCSWWIQAPPGKRVMVTFQDFSFYPRLVSKTSKYRGRCLQERVEIRTTNMAEGYMMCGEDIKPGTNLGSKGRDFMIIITTHYGYESTRGLKGKVTFID